MWKLIALVLAKMIRVKYVGGVTLKNSLVLLLRDPHHLDGNPWSCSRTRWSRTWCSLGNPLDQGLRSFFQCINLLLKLVLAFLLVVLWWKIILSLCSFERSRSYFSCWGTNFVLGYWSSSHSTPLALNFRSKPTPWSSGAFLVCVQFPRIAYSRQSSCKHLSL